MQEKRPPCLHTMGVKVGQSSARLDNNSNRLSVCVRPLSLSGDTTNTRWASLSCLNLLTTGYTAAALLLLFLYAYISSLLPVLSWAWSSCVPCGGHQWVPKKGAEGRGS